MKKVYVFAVLNILFFQLNAQFQWAVRAGMYKYDYAYGIVNDNQGNVYASGKYEQHGFFSPDSLPNQGNHDIWVAQYSPSGALNWISTGGGPGGDYSHGLTYDGSNNLYVAGEIEGAGNIITFPGSTITLAPVADNDIFLAKYDLSGNLLWAKSQGGYYSDKGLATTTDLSGNVYVSGYFTDTAIFNGSFVSGFGAEDIFLMKYDANGNFQWVKHAGSPGRDEGKAIKCDAQGNIYMTGMISNGANFGGQILSGSSGYFDSFLAKYDPNGNLVWVKKGGGSYDDVGWSLILDNQGVVYVSGEFNAYATFGSFGLTTGGNADVFVTAYDSNGNELWAKGAGGPLIDRARAIGTDGTNLYITGQFGANAHFGSNSVNAADSSDIFVAALSNSGSFLWAQSVGGPADLLETLGYESGEAITAEPAGDVYVAGATLNGGVFGNTNLPPYARTDVFISRMGTAPVPTGLAENKGSGNVSIYPNPSNGKFTFDLTSLASKKVEVNVYNCLGQLVITREIESASELSVDLSPFEKGIYFSEVRSENLTLSRSKLIFKN